MAAEPLVQACEVAFEVARRGWEATPPVEPPAPMRSFIYLPQLPRRAMTVAQRVMDEDPEFRSRVAAAATEASVGRAGYLWLHRPPGWEATFGMLTGGSPTVPPPLPATPAAAHPAAPNVGGSAAGAAPAPPPPPPPAPRSPVIGAPVPRQQPMPPAPSSQRPHPGRESIDSELAGLRDLVGRLTEEREELARSAPAGRLGESAPLAAATPDSRQEVSPRSDRDLENRIVTLEAQLREVAGQLDARVVEGRQTAASLASAASELMELRASADGLARENEQLRGHARSLETERDAARDEAASHQREHAALAAEQGEVTRRLEALGLQLDHLTASRDAALAEAAALRAEQARDQERFDLLDRGRADLEAELADLSGRWQRLQAEASDWAQRNAALEAELDLVRRLRASADAERRVLFGDLAVQLSRVEAERDLLASQLDLANGRLSGTRRALESANEELDACEGAFGETQRAADAVHAAVTEAGRRLDLLSDSLDDPPDPAPAAVDGSPDTGGTVEEDGPVADEASDLQDILASYGLGAGLPDDSQPEDSQPEAFQPEAFEASDAFAVEPSRSGTDAAPSSSAIAADETGVGTSQRAQVAVISGDPLSIARHTVTTAEVVLLIDGDPVAAMGWPMLGPIERRDALVGNLGDLVADTGAAADVVFDGNVAGDDQLPSGPAVRVRLTGIDVDPADAVSGLLDAYPLQWPIAVVTDNPELARVARDLGASVLDNGQLLDLFITP